MNQILLTNLLCLFIAVKQKCFAILTFIAQLFRTLHFRVYLAPFLKVIVINH